MDAPMLHITHDGQSLDFEQSVLDVGELSSDDQIKEAVARHLGVPATKFRNYAVDRHDGSLTLRPPATFG